MPGKLLPCPFCGSSGYVFQEGLNGFKARCTGKRGGCIELPRKHNCHFTSEQNAVVAWNRRAKAAVENSNTAALKNISAEMLRVAPAMPKAIGRNISAWAKRISALPCGAANTASLKSAPEVVESDSLCDYCQYGHNEDPGVCGACDDYNCFRGRRLQA